MASISGLPLESARIVLLHAGWGPVLAVLALGLLSGERRTVRGPCAVADVDLAPGEGALINDVIASLEGSTNALAVVGLGVKEELGERLGGVGAVVHVEVSVATVVITKRGHCLPYGLFGENDGSRTNGKNNGNLRVVFLLQN